MFYNLLFTDKENWGFYMLNNFPKSKQTSDQNLSPFHYKTDAHK